jgi:prepilin-type processing-associated H-X9-DG protein
VYVWVKYENTGHVVSGVPERRLRTGYYLLAGRNPQYYSVAYTTGAGITNPTSMLNFPARTSQPGKWILAADCVEQGTVNAINGKQTTAPHGKGGLVTSDPVASGAGPVPKDIGSRGGNVAFLDGSVSWVNQDDLFRYHATEGDTSSGVNNSNLAAWLPWLP